MKKYLITLVVAASAVLRAQAADLATQLQGYWQPDMEKTLALAKKANREIDPFESAIMGKTIFEFQKDKIIVHSPPPLSSDKPAVPYTVKAVDKTANSLTLKADGNEMKVRFDKGQMALYDPDNGWTIFNRMSKEAFAKRQGGGAKKQEMGGDEAPAAGKRKDVAAQPIPDKPAAGKLKDISAQPIPDKPAAGKVCGKEFKVEAATLMNDILELRQGSGFFADVEFKIFLFGQESGFDGKKITVKPSQDFGKPHIHLGRMVAGKNLPESKTFLNEYTMILEFGNTKNGKIPGKIHLRLPDEAGSFVVGTFEAKVK